MEKRQIFGVFALLAVTAAVVCGAGPGPGQAQDVPPEGETVQVLAAAPVARVEGETLPGTYDFDHDGAPETVELAHCQYPDSPAVEVTDLHIVTKAGETLWTAFAASAHAGWNSLFACTLEGGDYLLEYHPTMYQGWCDYTYRLFSLGADGEELVLRESAVSFDINWGSPLGHSFDPEAIATFIGGSQRPAGAEPPAADHRRGPGGHGPGASQGYAPAAAGRRQRVSSGVHI